MLGPLVQPPALVDGVAEPLTELDRGALAEAEAEAWGVVIGGIGIAVEDLAVAAGVGGDDLLGRRQHGRACQVGHRRAEVAGEVGLAHHVERIAGCGRGHEASDKTLRDIHRQVKSVLSMAAKLFFCYTVAV